MSIRLDLNSALPLNRVVGQTKVVQTLLDYVSVLETGAAMPNLALYADPGYGKTAIAKAIGAEMVRRLRVTDYRREVCFLNLKGTKNKTDADMTDLFKIMAEALSGEGWPATVILDEAFTEEARGSGNAEVTSILSKVGADCKGGEVISIYGQGDFPYNPQRLNFIILTWSPKRARADVMSRYPENEDLRFAPYTVEELMEIMHFAIPSYIMAKAKEFKGEISVNHHARRFLAECMRGNARDMEHGVCEPLYRRAILENGISVDKAGALALSVQKNLLPYGLNATEAKILHELSLGQKLTSDELKARAGISSKELFLSSQLYLRSQGGKATPFQLRDSSDEPLPGKCGALIDISSKKWGITNHGAVMVTRLRKGGWRI